MADVVQYRLERMVDELDDLERRGLFTRPEIAEIVKQRRKFEYRLKRPCPLKQDYLAYIDYETQLDSLRQLRKKAVSRELKKQGGKRMKKSVSDFASATRIIDIYRLAVSRYKGDIDLWFRYLEFCRQRKNGRMKKVLAQLIRFHPKVPGVWIYAAAWEFDHNTNVTAARSLMLSGLRVCPTSEDLWIEYLRMELTYLNKLKARKVALGEDEGSLVRDNRVAEEKQWREENKDLFVSLGEEREDDGGSIVETESENQLDLFEVQGSNILETIYNGAVEATPSSFSLRKRVLEILEATNLAHSEELHSKILEDFRRDFSTEPHYWDWLARLEYHPESTPGTSDNMRISQIEKAVQVYEDALKCVPSSAMFSLYAEFLMSIIAPVKVEQNSELSNQTKKFTSHLLMVYEKAETLGQITEDLGCQHVSLYLQLGRLDEARELLKKLCTGRLSNSGKLWVLRVSTEIKCIIKDSPTPSKDDLESIFKLTKEVLRDFSVSESEVLWLVKIDEKAINEVFLKVLDNYIKWCRYLRIRLAWNSLEAINRDRKLFLVSLYLLIWGEAANVRFLPECLCYLFHNMAKELDAILDHGEATHAASCITDDGSVSFLQKIICPIYETLSAETERNKNGKAAHSAWRNYDDFNEYFWSPTCFELGWPMKKESRFLRKPKGSKRTGKTSFVEHRTFLHLYRSFHRLWIFLAIVFQALAVFAFHGERLTLNTFKAILSIGPTFAIMNFIESCLDVLLTFGAYTTARGMAISRIVIRFFWWGSSSVCVTFLYVKVLQERNGRSSDNSFFFRIYIIVLGVYASLRLLFSMLLKFPACHRLSEMSDQSFFQFFKWIYQERYYVGRGLYEKPSDYCRYVAFWLVLLVCKFTFAYFLQIKPLVQPTTIIVNLPSLQYSWYSFVSKNNNNVSTVASLWAPVVALYLLDIYIWYTLLSAVIGGVKGARARLGEIRSLEMMHKRFESFPEAFVKNLVSSQTKSLAFNSQAPEDSPEMNKKYAAIFSPFWNEIIKSLREEDYISNREMDLLSIPSNTGSLRLVQWPLFLLSSKIFLAVDLALDCKDTQADLWNRICRDEYMAYAVKECYYSVEKILNSLDDGEGRLWVERIFREINNSISEGSLVITLHLKKIPLVLQKFTALTGLLTRNETPELAKGAAKAVFELYEVVTHDLLSSDLREQLDTWNILLRARNEGRLFSQIKWPKDPEIKELVKRLHLLLTVKDSAANIPKNLEARRRLEFFTNSLFMDMPSAKPVSEMVAFSVFTPYYSETVLYSSSELRMENEDGISILFYLQKIFPDEWENFLERIGRSHTTGEAELQKSPSDALELRFWVSYRGQTLARTVRGMMYYRRALMLQSYLERRSFGDDYSQTNFPTSQGFEFSRESRAQADLKFTYVISCQIYGQQKQRKAPEATDIALLLQRNEALRVAFIHVEDSVASDGKVAKEFYSKLVKADIHGKDQEIFSIKLPGEPKLGEGKPENQNHAIIFTRGDAVQTIDMNQDNYFEEAIKMRNLLEEFHEKHGLRPPTILGVREHVFTGSVSSLAWFMSNQETSFVTLGQRVLASPLKVRMHYGHPDVFDRVFHITRGGISKASRVINISEDIYAGFNSTLRQGNITHHEYIQVGKGRDVGLNQIALFEGKVAGGNGEQVLSRDIYRLGQLFDFFRMLSFYFTTVGYYACTMMTVLVVYIFLYGRVYLAFSGLDEAISKQARILGNTALNAALNAQFLFQIGVFTAIPMIMGFILELGLLKAVFSFITMQLQLCSVFFTFSLGTRTHYFGRTILHGGAKYRATGRGFVVQHIKFAENYRLYSRSHFIKALEVALLLIVYMAYGYSEGGASSFVLLTLSSWFLVISWLFAPYIFNPSGFEWQKTVEDFDNWTSWLFYKGGVGVRGENSWESWWDEEQAHIQTWRGRILETILTVRFLIFQFGIVYKLHLTGTDTSLALYGFSWAVLVLLVLIFKIFTFSPKKSTNFQLLMRFIQGVTAITLVAALGLIVGLTDLSLTDLFASVLAFIPTGWAILCVAITWKRVVRSLGLWDSVREFARMYDAGMGLIIFVPVAFLSWFPFVSTFQSRLLFNQAFSRGLEISLILAGNKANVET